MAKGRVCTGFSHPVVALYNNDKGTVTYTNGRVLARGVSVSLSLDASDDNKFYADNVLAESEVGEFGGGTAKLTVDGLLQASEKMITGLPEPEEVTYGESKKVNIYRSGKDAKPPYVGIGVVVRYQSDGVETYVPIILRKAKFNQPGLEAKTQEEKKGWQTQELEAALHRDDTEKKDWRWIAEDQTSEADAIAILHGILNVVEE